MRTFAVALWLVGLSVASFYPSSVSAQEPARQPVQKIDVNTATAEELEKLPGIGAATAKRILAGRPFRSIDELKFVGVSDVDFAKLKPLVEARFPVEPRKPPAEPSRKVDLNTATAEEIERVPGIGPATVKKILAARPLKSVDDLKAMGLSDADVEKLAALVEVKSSHTAAAEAVLDKELDLNSATLEQLQALPAVGDVYAKKIIAGRPYKSISDLSRAGIPDFAIAKITSLVTVEAPARTPPRPGMVWANTDSKIFHKEGDRWYGRTHVGEWMTEPEAIRAGYRKAK